MDACDPGNRRLWIITGVNKTGGRAMLLILKVRHIKHVPNQKIDSSMLLPHRVHCHMSYEQQLQKS